MKIEKKTLQEHIWFNMEEIKDYSVWDWVELFEHFNIPLKRDKDYNAWVRELEGEGRI